MANSDPAADPAPPGTFEPAGPRRRRNRALLVFAMLAGLCSALLVAEASTHPAPKAVSQGTTTLNIAEAAAVAATSADTIQIKNYAFAPASATVPVGVKVTWVNEDSVPHTVTTKSGPASFDSGQVAPGASYSAIFETPGTYSYYCIDHPQMVATITVTGSGGGGGTGGSPSPTPSSHPSSTPSSGGGGGGTGGGSPSATPSSGMSMPGPSSSASTGGVIGSLGGGSGSGCASLSQSLLPLLQHIDATHLGESPGQQVQDLSNVNQYVLTHTTLVENMLIPLWNSANQSVTGLLGPLLQHIDTTHLGESPGQQVNDLLNLDQYVLTHTKLVENMIIPAQGVLTGSC